MFHPDDLADMVSAYKKSFPVRWKEENYKWKAILHFQKYWDLEAENFQQMFMKATEKTSNLLANRNNYPRQMIGEFAGADAEAVRSMFRSLFDESEDLSQRIGQFQVSADWLRMKYDAGMWKQHYQTANAITTYLWLKNPDQYYIYKYSDVFAMARAIKSEFQPVRSDAIFNVQGAYQLYGEIREILRRDSELDEIFQSVRDESCYPDPERVTMMTDLAFFVSRSYRKQQDKIRTENRRNLISADYPDYSDYPERTGDPGYVNSLTQEKPGRTSKENAEEKKKFEPVPIEIEKEKKQEKVWAPYTRQDFLNDVYIEENQLNMLIRLLKNKKNLILQGAPGVGKTFMAKRLAYVMMGKKEEPRIHLVQFHQSYSYEDFVMGYKPEKEGFALKEGIFYRACQEARENPDQEYFFLIDEINRGNLSKIFGELLMLIEKDYRGSEAMLAYSQTMFSVPENLYLIGTMNTADRSLAMMDYALRRRFSFFEIVPGFRTEGFRRYQKSLENEKFDKLIEQIIELNREIQADESLGAGFCIGHSYFCGQDRETCTDEWMQMVVNYDIIPMLREYWFDEQGRVHRWEERLLSAKKKEKEIEMES